MSPKVYMWAGRASGGLGAFGEGLDGELGGEGSRGPLPQAGNYELGIWRATWCPVLASVTLS